MAQKVNLETLNIDQLNQYKEKAVKMIVAGGILTYAGAGVTVTGGALLLQFIIKDVRDKNPDTDQTPANIYIAITTCGLISIATGIPLMAIGTNKKERIEIYLKKFDKVPKNSAVPGLGITLRF